MATVIIPKERGFLESAVDNPIEFLFGLSGEPRFRNIMVQSSEEVVVL